MSPFQVYFEEGREHILDWKDGYDHILFVIALAALYLLRDWKRVLILVTAFTIGHSVTLALASFGIVAPNRNLVEFLISASIFVTAISNLFKNEETIDQSKVHINYLYALFFGLVHGLGFAGTFRALAGKDESIVSPLLAFNLGLELGQIIIVVLFLTASFIFVDLFGVSRRDWKMVISSMIAGISLMLMKNNAYWMNNN